MVARRGLWAGDKRQRASEAGQTLAEFAIILFFLVVLVVGLLDLSRAVYVRHQVAGAARDGARYATTHPPKTAEAVERIEAVARSLLVGFEQDSMVVEVSQPDEYHVRVDVTYTFRPIAAFIFGGAEGSNVDITMHSGSVMRREWTYHETE